ncbi:unnamed protein product, partial [Prorocentrum cordatum]
MRVGPLCGFAFIRRRFPVSTLDCAGAASKLTKLASVITLAVAEASSMKWRGVRGALELPDLLHMCFNAAEEATVSLRERAPRELLLEAVAAARSREKDRLWTITFKNAPPHGRRAANECSGQRVDWRWEHLEETLFSINVVRQSLRKYFDPAAIGASAERAARCRKVTLQKEWFEAMSMT